MTVFHKIKHWKDYLHYYLYRLRKYFSPGGVRLDIRVTTRDAKGNVIWCSGWKRSHSFVIAFLSMFSRSASNTALNQNVIDITNTSRSNPSLPNFTGAAAQTTSGIVVGTGSTTPTDTDYKLQTLIAHGATAGLLLYGGTSWTFLGDTGSGHIDILEDRILTNSSGGDITVNEVGIYCTDSGNVYCLAHDLLTFTIVNLGSSTVEYRIRTTV